MSRSEGEWEWLHVIPIGDKKIHCANKNCWCFPVPDKDPTGNYAPDTIWVHNAADCREKHERQENRQKSKWLASPPSEAAMRMLSTGWVFIGETTDDYAGSSCLNSVDMW